MSPTKKESRLIFRHFVADADLNNRNVSVYSPANAPDTRVLIVENRTSNKPLTNPLVISRDKYAELRELWTDGGKLSDNDATITKAAIAYCFEVKGAVKP